MVIRTFTAPIRSPPRASNPPRCSTSIPIVSSNGSPMQGADANAMRAMADFSAARTKAVFRDLLALFSGRRNELLAYDAVREKLHVGGPIYRGVHSVRL